MNNLVKKNKSLKCGFVIKLLSIIALVCTLLSSVSYFLYYASSYLITGELVYKLTFKFPYFMNLIPLLLSIAPSMLFVLYIFKYHNELKATVLVPTIFGVLAFEILFNFLTGSSRFYYGIFALIQLFVLIACILALISALKGFNKKIYVLIAMSGCLLFEALTLVSVFPMMEWYIEGSMYLYIFTSPLSIIGSISFYVALLLFSTKNRIPAIIAVSVKKKNAESMNPEQALRVLKDKLEFGMISEEEYQAQRVDIINKL